MRIYPPHAIPAWKWRNTADFWYRPNPSIHRIFRAWLRATRRSWGDAV